MNIGLGVPIPLNYQLSDYTNESFVRATLYDESGTLLTSVALPLFDTTGLYANFSTPMPNTPWVLAKYAVYDDAGFTILSNTEGGGSEVFTLSAPSPVQSVVGIVQC